VDSEHQRADAQEAVSQRAVIDALPRAVVVTTLDTRILLWNRQAELLYGWQPEEVRGRSVLEVLAPVEIHPDAHRILDDVAAGQTWEGDLTVLRRNGDPVRVWVTIRPVCDEAGQIVALLGASEDVTEERLLAQRTADLTEHLRLALEAGGLGTFRWDMATGRTDWDPHLEALFGLEPGSFNGTFDAWVALLHPDDVEHVLNTVNEAVASKGRYTVEHRVVWPDGSLHWLHGSGQVTLGPRGQVTGTIGCTADVTERVNARQQLERLTREAVEAAEHERISRERLEFLGRINDALAESRDRHDLMSNVVRAAVPRLGDWCVLYVLPAGDERIPDVEFAHIDPTMVAYGRELFERFPYDPSARFGVPYVIRTGRAEFYPEIDSAVLAGLETTEEARDVARELALRSSITVPLVKKGRILGALQLVMTGSGRLYTEDDLALARAAAGRIASSIENQRLTDEQRTIASTLQASLLPHSLPVIPGAEVAVRYWATGEAIEVGGDFYDIFEVVPDTSWAVVIGDVCGTGPRAAAVTGLARHTIAAAAWHGDDPATVLQNLNRTMRARGTDRFLTVVYGTVEPARGGVAVSLTCAGHPLPVLIRADGGVGTIGEPGSLIGVLEKIRVSTVRSVLEPGDTVVLYTDGLTDVPPPYHLTEAGFSALVSEAAANARSAEDIADGIHARLSAIRAIDKRNDDMALLIIRVPEPASKQ
jgi:PAS domain S-box-containing protein